MYNIDVMQLQVAITRSNHPALIILESSIIMSTQITNHRTVKH